MTNINISLPETLTSYLEEQVNQGGYNTVSDYLQVLIHEDQQRKAKESLENSLLAGLESGEASLMTKNDWEIIRNSIRVN